jgi:hypothetical protein
MLAPMPPEVTTNAHTVGKITNYDPSTGTGDATFTGYFGGTCHGALFDKTGATEIQAALTISSCPRTANGLTSF